MTRYMPQDVFDAGALVIAMSIYRNLDPLPIAQKLAEDYRRQYSDSDMARDWLLGAQAVMKVLPSLFNQPDMNNERFAAACASLVKAVDGFEVSGKRKRRWLKGAMFVNEKAPITDKPRHAASNIVAYHFAIVSGDIQLKELR